MTQQAASPLRRLASVALLVRDYDEAINWFTERLGFQLLLDTPLEGDKRWVVVGPETGARLILAKAADARQSEGIGGQAGGRVAFFLETDDFARDHDAMAAKGVEFLETPRREAYGTVAVFCDLYGNKWDLIEPATPV